MAYLCPPQHTLDELERTLSYTISMVPPLMAELAAQWITDGTADRTLAAKREEAAARNAAAREILDGYPLVSRATGFFCWLELPDSWTGIAFAKAALEKGVLVAEGEHFLMGHAPGKTACAWRSAAFCGARIWPGPSASSPNFSNPDQGLPRASGKSRAAEPLPKIGRSAPYREKAERRQHSLTAALPPHE